MNNENKKKILSLLGLAHRARKIITGEEAVLETLRANLAKLVFVAGDASEKTLDNFNRKCFFYHVPVCFELKSDELAQALGKTLCKIVAVTDQGFFQSIQEKINGGEKNEG